MTIVSNIYSKFLDNKEDSEEVRLNKLKVREQSENVSFGVRLEIKI